MSHFFTVVFVPDTTPEDSISNVVDFLLKPFDENREVAPYKRYSEYGEEEDSGGKYSITTYNPKSKWDYYVIGGRWNGEIRNTAYSNSSELNFRAGPGAEQHTIDENMIHVSQLDHKLSCFAMLTPDGEWHERGKMGWWAVVSEEKEEEVWEAEMLKCIRENRECYLIGVDCHI